jgi:hypothetical protein
MTIIESPPKLAKLGENIQPFFWNLPVTTSNKIRMSLKGTIA